MIQTEHLHSFVFLFHPQCYHNWLCEHQNVWLKLFQRLNSALI